MQQSMLRDVRCQYAFKAITSPKAVRRTRHSCKASSGQSHVGSQEGSTLKPCITEQAAPKQCGQSNRRQLLMTSTLLAAAAVQLQPGPAYAVSCHCTVFTVVTLRAIDNLHAACGVWSCACPLLQAACRWDAAMWPLITAAARSATPAPPRSS